MKKIIYLRYALVLVVLVRFECAAQTYYDVTAVNGSGFRFWGGSQYYKIHMGNAAEYQFGPVTDYSIKSNMDGTAGRGWTWGIHQSTPVAAIGSSGIMQLSHSLYVGPAYGSVPTPGRIAATGNHAELSLNNRAFSGFVQSPSQGERWVLYNNGTVTDGKLRFWSGGDKIVFTKEGNVGFGMDAPTAMIHVNSAIERQAFRIFRNGNTTKYLSVWQGTGAGVIDPIGSGLLYLGYDVTTDVLMNGKLGVGTDSPAATLDVRGNVLVENGGNPIFFTGTGTIELNRYFQLINSPGVGSGAGLKASGILISDTHSYANPGKNDLIVKGNVGIGTPAPDAKLSVKGQIHAQEVKVDLDGAVAPDYVFDKEYKLRSLEEIQSYITANKHLPEVPSAKEMEKNGMNLGDMNLLLLKKIEELTLHMIAFRNENDELKKQIGRIEGKLSEKTQIKELRSGVDSIKK